MRRARLLLIVVPLLLGLASYAAVQKMAVSRTPLAQGPAEIGLLNDYLGLTPEQRQSVADVNAGVSKSRQELREQVWRTRDELLKVLADPDSTSQQGIEAVRRFGDAQKAMQENTIEYIFELRKHLNPEQKTKLASLMNRGMCGVVCGQGAGMGKGAGGKRGACGLGMGLGPCGGGQGRR